MSTQHAIFNIKKKIALNYPKSAALGFCFKGLKDEFETAVVDEPSVFEPLKFYCRWAAWCLCGRAACYCSGTWVSFISGWVKAQQIRIEATSRYDWNFVYWDVESQLSSAMAKSQPARRLDPYNFEMPATTSWERTVHVSHSTDLFIVDLCCTGKGYRRIQLLH